MFNDPFDGSFVGVILLNINLSISFFKSKDRFNDFPASLLGRGTDGIKSINFFDTNLSNSFFIISAIFNSLSVVVITPGSGFTK